MDKVYRKQHRLSGVAQQRLGLPLGIHDKDGNSLYSGDVIDWAGEKCILLWSRPNKMYMALLTRTNYSGGDKYWDDSYSCAYEISLDDGARMEIKRVESINEVLK